MATAPSLPERPPPAEGNPYAPPAEFHASDLLPADPLLSRRKQLAAERSVKVLGWALLVGLAWIFSKDLDRLARFDPTKWLRVLGFLFETILPVTLGFGLAFLWPSARIVGTIVALVVVFRLEWPLSLAPAALLLFLIHSKWTRDLFSPVHKILRQATPELDLRRRTILLMMLAALLLTYAAIWLGWRGGG
jgi:hypothetical protein